MPNHLCDWITRKISEPVLLAFLWHGTGRDYCTHPFFFLPCFCFAIARGALLIISYPSVSGRTGRQASNRFMYNTPLPFPFPLVRLLLQIWQPLSPLILADSFVVSACLLRRTTGQCTLCRRRERASSSRSVWQK